MKNEKKPGKFLVLNPCTDCEEAERKAAKRGRPNPHLAVCNLHVIRRNEPEPMVGFRPGFVRANLRGAGVLS